MFVDSSLRSLEGAVQAADAQGQASAEAQLTWLDRTLAAREPGEQAIVAAGKKPGKDVRIYSTGATNVGVQRVKQAAWNETTIFLPFQESYYAGVALIMALEGKPANAYVNEAEMPPVTKLGSLYVTKQNAARFRPNY